MSTSQPSNATTSEDRGLLERSLRSRASSVVSTGTKSSIGTLHREEPMSSNLTLVRDVLRLAARRPGSILSVTSLEHAAPPYEGLNLSASTITERAADSDDRQVSDRPSPQCSEAELYENNSPLTADTDNALFAHYQQIVSTVDQNYQQQLAEMRQRIDNIDQAYRKELRARDREVEKAREEVATREDQILEEEQVAVDKARNQVEDIWEMRWKDIIRLQGEEMRRLELEGQKALERAVAERDEEWIAALTARHPHLAEELITTRAELRAGKE
ncbi:hypothetical protein LPUS_05351 [Lasallia pustulata]|uniref:Uncharacterized protein n=1 Tax=Lasallia pustulata TaxID=136370 RepID=A0A1W5CYN5_9LECA|nr:hypothetical protein LPUS_05351 [Lasallia pustulata]